MKTTGQRWHLRNRHELNAFIEHVEQQWADKKYPTVLFMKADRSSQQNRYIYALYSDIARQTGEGIVETKRQCKLMYGIPILRGSDPAFCSWYDQNVKRLPLEVKLALMDHLPVTSEFSTEQGTEYIDTLLKEYANRGYYLIDPR